MLLMIYPAVTINKEIEYNYIPVCEAAVREPNSTEPIWKRGVYLLRIIVTPTKPHITYYYNSDTLVIFQRQVCGKKS